MGLRRRLQTSNGELKWAGKLTLELPELTASNILDGQWFEKRECQQEATASE